MRKFAASLLVLLSFSAVAKNAIDTKCPQHVVWGAPQVAQEGNNQYICKTGWAANYSYTTKVSTFVVETIKAENLGKGSERGNNFREDPEVPDQHRSTLKDYAKSGYDRGHMAPAANFTYNSTVMSESFYLTNMMPQVPGNNRGVWKYLEEYTRYWAQKHGQVYVITGTIFGQQSPVIGNGVYVPTHIYKIVIDPKKQRAIAFLFPNAKIEVSTIEQYNVSIRDIETYTNINFSPELPQNLRGIETTKTSIQQWEQ